MGEVVRFADFQPKPKEKPEEPANIVRLHPETTGVGFGLVDGVLVQFPIQTCQQEPD